MNLLTFISNTDRKRALAERTGRSEGYLWQVATGWRGKRASPELAQLIERESSDIGPEAVTKESLRPDIWAPTDAKGPDSHQGQAAAKGNSAAEADADSAQPVGRAA